MSLWMLQLAGMALGAWLVLGYGRPRTVGDAAASGLLIIVWILPAFAALCSFAEFMAERSRERVIAIARREEERLK